MSTQPPTSSTPAPEKPDRSMFADWDRAMAVRHEQGRGLLRECGLNPDRPQRAVTRPSHLACPKMQVEEPICGERDLSVPRDPARPCEDCVGLSEGVCPFCGDRHPVIY